MRWMAGLGLVTWITLTGCAAPVRSDAEKVVVCGGYLPVFNKLLRPGDFHRIVRETGTADLAGDRKLIEIPPGQVIAGGEILAGRMDPARVRELQQEGAQLARRHFETGNAVATGHFLSDCVRRLWAEFGQTAGSGRPKR